MWPADIVSFNEESRRISRLWKCTYGQIVIHTSLMPKNVAFPQKMSNDLESTHIRHLSWPPNPNALCYSRSTVNRCVKVAKEASKWKPRKKRANCTHRAHHIVGSWGQNKCEARWHAAIVGAWTRPRQKSDIRAWEKGQQPLDHQGPPQD
jgi:hypothetical protein